MSYLPPSRPGDEPEDAPSPYGTPDPYGIPDPSRPLTGGTPSEGDPTRDGRHDPYGSPPPMPSPAPSPYGPYGQQGSPYARGPVGFPPPNHLVWAILSTVLCCMPAGVVSIVYAAQVNSKWAMGDVQGARASSTSARTWAVVSAVLAGLFWGLAFLSGLSS